MLTCTRKFGLLLLPLLAFGERAAALDPATSDAHEVLRVALEQKVGDRAQSRMNMLIKDRTGQRQRLMTTRSKRAVDARKTLISIEQPEDVRGTGFLNIDYRARERRDEQWLYLPALHRTARVPSSGRSDAFVGSDFSIFDLSANEADNYDARMLAQDVQVGGEACWLIEATPRTRDILEESGYEKTQFWVSKSKLMPLQFKAWLVKGKTKYFKAADLRLVNGIWTPFRTQMRTLVGSEVVSETLLEVLSADNDAKDVSDGDFTQQRLERGV